MRNVFSCSAHRFYTREGRYSTICHHTEQTTLGRPRACSARQPTRATSSSSKRCPPTQTPSTCTLPLSRRTQSRYCSVQISLLPPLLRYASPKTVHPSAIGRGDVRPPRPCRGKKRLLTPRRMATPARRCSRSRRTGSPHRGAAARAPRAARRHARASPCTRRMGSPERACGWERACGRRTEGPPSSPSKRSRRGARRRPSGPTSAWRRRGAAAARVGQGRRTANERGGDMNK